MEEPGRKRLCERAVIEHPSGWKGFELGDDLRPGARLALNQTSEHLRVGTRSCETHQRSGRPPRTLEPRHVVPVSCAEIDKMEFRVQRLALQQPGPGRIGRAVVDRDDLERAAGRTVERALDRGKKRVGFVVSRDDQ